MSTDSQLRHDVEAELDWDTRVDARRIGISAMNGVVSLTGSVSSYFEQQAAEEAAQSVAGVLADRLRITVHDGWVHLEGEVLVWAQLQTAESALIHLPGIKGITNDIVVNSQASVDNVKALIEQAEAAARHAPGVSRIIDHLEVRP